ncbi:MAG: TetR/AcrR family transcriptional regulator [Polyangiales bacterium]
MRAMARVHNSHSPARARAAVKPRKEARQERSRATVDSLLRASARILVRDGYAGLTTNAVAELAGVSVGSLYQYFPNKDALVTALIAEHVDTTMTRFRSDAASLFALPVERAIPRFVHIMIEMHRADPALHRVFAEQLPLGAFPRLESSIKEGTALARAYLEAHKAELIVKDLDVAAFLIVQTVDTLTHAAVIMRPELLETPSLENELVACLVRYLKGS